MRMLTLPLWSGKFFSVNVGLLGRTVLHLIEKLRLIVSAGACESEIDQSGTSPVVVEGEGLSSFSMDIGEGSTAN